MSGPLTHRFPGSSRFYLTPYASPASDPSGTPSQRRYHYVDVHPPSSVPQRATLLLLHGFPDTSYGWRNVISPLTLRGYRIIAPDLVGYGLSSAPDPSTHLAEYGSLTIARDLEGLLDYAKAGVGAQYGAPNSADGKGGRVVVIGHDWGGWLAWKVAQFSRHRIMGVSSLCVPYPAPASGPVTLEQIVDKIPSFGYQLFFADPRSTEIIQNNLDKFLQLIFRAPGLFTTAERGFEQFETPDAERASNTWVQKGKLEKLLTANKLPAERDLGQALLSPGDYEVYRDSFAGRMVGPLSWYRTRAITQNDEKNLQAKGLPTDLPAMFVSATRDAALPVQLGAGVPSLVPSVRMKTVQAGHWVMLESPGLIEGYIRDWVEEEVFAREDEKRGGVVGWIKDKASKL